MARRCYLVYALAPAGMGARVANDLLNEYAGEERRGIPVYHDHFVGEHGGFVVFDARTDAEREALDQPGVLEGWNLSVHPLTFSLTGVGLAAQVDFTLERYGGTTLAALAEDEEDDPRYWWREDDA
jgi:hypothetical protein